MDDVNIGYFAALLCVYSLYEFFIRRACLRHSGLPSKKFKHALVQGVILFSVMAVGTSGFLSVKLASGYAAIGVLYFISEFTVGESSQKSRWALEYFTLKQLLFGTLLFSLWKYASPIAPNEWYACLENQVLSGLGKFSGVLREKWTVVLLITSAYLFVIDGGTRIVRGVFNKFPRLYGAVVAKLDKESGKENEENVGEWIGVLERVITLTFVLTGSFTALAFALTAKSIARFKELEDKQFAEYYILGTSASLIVALFAGMMIKVLFGF